MQFIWYSKTIFLFYLAGNILGIEWIKVQLLVFCLYILILVCNSQWHRLERIWFFCPEGHVPMRNFLTSLWNEGKQLQTFNSKVSPQLQIDSDNQTFLRKKRFARQKANLINWAWHENQIWAYMQIVSAKSWSARCY